MSMAEKMNVSERWKVLVVGNNPIELGHVFERLQGIQHKTILAEMAFDLQTILQRLAYFQPQYILIDDNIGKTALRTMVSKLHERRTRHVPITVLKNSNYHETIGAGVMNYVLKQNLTSELLYRELINSLQFLESQRYWEKAYRKRKGQLKRLLSTATRQI
jgi:CheY-like chemotaxis protein